MTSKALKKQLIAAVAMVLVAAVALSGSTFAWFAQNSEVTASPVSVTAQTAQNLSISLTNNGSDWATSVTLASPASRLWPLSVADGTTAIGTTATTTLTTQSSATFYGIKSENKVPSANAYGASVSFPTALASSSLLDENFTDSSSVTTPNYWTDDIYLRYEYTAGESNTIDVDITVMLPANVTINSSSVEMSSGLLKVEKAMHIAFATEARKWVNLDLTGATYHDADAEHATPYLTISTTELLTINANEPQLVIAYIWYEGEDDDCFTNNATAPFALTTSIVFKLHNVA